MVIIKNGKIYVQPRPLSNKRFLISKYNSLRKEMKAAGIKKVPPAIVSGRKKWLSGAYGKLMEMAMA